MYKKYVVPTRDEIVKELQEQGIKTPCSLRVVQNMAIAAFNAQHNCNEVFTDDATEKVIDFIQNIVWMKSSKTPLTQALRMLAAIEASIQDSLTSDEFHETSEENEKILFLKKEIQASAIKKAEDLIKTLEASKSLINGVFQKTENTEISVAQLSKDQLQILKNMAILSERGKIKSHKIKQTQTFEEMNAYSQIAQIASMSAMVMPTFNYKFATKQLIVKTPKQESKQLLVLAIDSSGSMKEDKKVQWVKAIVLNRLQAVMDGEANLIICNFENVIEDVVKITNKKEAENFAKNFQPKNNGGVTNVANVIKALEDNISSKAFKIEGENPQIVIMNDGEDTVVPFACKYQVNAFILGQNNQGFKDLILANKGHYERFL